MTHAALSNRPVILYAVVALLAASLTAACSGAETQDVLGGAASSSASSSTSSGGTSTSSSGGTSSSSGATSSSSSSSGATSDCTQEVEPNDGRDTANPLTSPRCGTLTKRDRIDVLTFRLKPSTKTVSINFTGRVRLRVIVEGKPTTELTPDSAGVIPFVMNEDYIVEVTPLTDSTSEIPWRVEVVEK